MNFELLTPSDQTTVFLLRITLAALLGGLIGLERDIHGRAAGLRTHLLVSAGSALFMILSMLVSQAYLPIVPEGTPIPDPGRIAAQVVTGIGFVGAGAIIKEGLNVRGLTTAACLWMAAAIGLAAGAGEYTLAITTTGISIFALIVLNRTDILFARDSYRHLNLKTSGDANVKDIINVVKRKHVGVMYCDFEKNYQDNVLQIDLFLRVFTKGLPDTLSKDIIDDLENSEIPVHSVSWAH